MIDVEKNNLAKLEESLTVRIKSQNDLAKLEWRS